VFSFPPLVWKFIAPDDPEAFTQDAAKYTKGGFLSRWLERERPAPDVALGEGEGEDTDVDKAWHGIHYLLTGTAWEGEPPLNFLLLGGRELPDIEVGYGPARILTSAETRGAHEAIASVTDEWLRSRFNPADMMSQEIYPEIWNRDPAEDDTLEYCIEMFQVLRTYLANIAGKNLGTIITLQ
jgi:hypothetical protein